MPQNLIINDVKYINVESISMLNENGDKVVYKEETDVIDVASVLLSEKLNYYTGETELMTLEEITEKIDLLLGSLTNNKAEFKYKFYYAQDITNFPKLDTSSALSLAYMYYYCDNEDTVFPWLDLSSCEDISYMYFRTMASIYPMLNTSKVKNFTRALYQCKNMLGFPFDDTSSGENFNRMCDSCSKMTYAKLNLSNATDVTNILNACNALVDLIIEGTIYISGLNLSTCNALSHDSLMSVINALADYSSDTSGNTHSLVLGATNLAKLSDEEKAIATQKGWTLS